MLMFFFFKQKTAYEMRISDWSSDVCSSDLWKTPEALSARRNQGRHPVRIAALFRGSEGRRDTLGRPQSRLFGDVDLDHAIIVDGDHHRPEAEAQQPLANLRETFLDLPALFGRHVGDDIIVRHGCSPVWNNLARSIRTPRRVPIRSEEHTSVQSLMRISYAVFCL